MKKLVLKMFYITAITISFLACSNTDDDETIDEPDNSSASFLSLQKKYNNNITQPKVTLIGEIAKDFEVIDAGYWQSGNTIQFVNGVVSLRYLNTNTITPTAVIVRLKDNSGTILAEKKPTVTSLSETSYLLSGGSTFLRNVSPLSFIYEESVDLEEGVNLTSTVTSENNVTYAQGTSNKDILQLVQVFLGDNTSNPDFTGSFTSFAEVELEYFTQIENISTNNSFVTQKYFENSTTNIKPATGNFSISNNPSFNTNTETWSFSITNNTSAINKTLNYRFILQDVSGTAVAFEIENNISFQANETKEFAINQNNLFSSLSFLSVSEIQNLSTKVLLEW